ncbi:MULTISPECIES: hypothetical protein [Niastella]|uniref:Uncharacterized protein n=1 Tax=Niastella soli TaxID=2821487 RepID=A0ABS3Z3R5_9BACT|nr:hypothetical protein [Niastella soli]MBO9204280.1 hypothetical protein [Niastella soli]
MMNTIRKFLKDVTSIFSSVPEKQMIRTVAAKGSLTCRFAQPVTISTKQFGRRAAIAQKAIWLQ